MLKLQSVLRYLYHFVEPRTIWYVNQRKWISAFLTCWIVGLPLTLTLEILLATRAKARASWGLAPSTDVFDQNLAHWTVRLWASRSYAWNQLKISVSAWLADIVERINNVTLGK